MPVCILRQKKRLPTNHTLVNLTSFLRAKNRKFVRKICLFFCLLGDELWVSSCIVSKYAFHFPAWCIPGSNPHLPSSFSEKSNSINMTKHFFWESYDTNKVSKTSATLFSEKVKSLRNFFIALHCLRYKMI